MIEFFRLLFDTSDFPARWYCGEWSPGLGWLHIVSDLVTCFAYYTIPLTLVWFVRRRGDVPFNAVFMLFCMFIAACGTVHLVEATIFWHPWYRLSGLTKLVMAIVSILTAVVLIRVMPSAIQLPGLARVNMDLERAQADLQRRTDELALFASVASHDLREPVRHARMLTTAIEDDYADKLDEEGQQMLTMLRESSERMDALIVSLAAWARADRVDAAQTEVDLVQQTRRVFDDLTALAEESGAALSVSGHGRAFADETLVHQVLQNLVTNAIRYARPATSPVVVVAVTRLVDRVEIDVTDNGRGFPEDRMNDAFRPFRRLATDGEGTGLGLALARRLARRMGGDLTIVATGPTGSTLRVTLPAGASA